MKIKIIAIGNGAAKIINNLIRSGVENNFYLVANHKYTLENSNAKYIIPLGQKLTGGLGTTGDLLLGKRIARAEEKELKELVSYTDIIGLISCLGGGLGSAVTGEIARLSRQNTKTKIIGIFTLPFKEEGIKAAYRAEVGIKDIKGCLDAHAILEQDKVIKDIKQMNISFKYTDAMLIPYITGVLNKLSAADRINFNTLLKPDKHSEFLSIRIKEEMEQAQSVRDSMNYKSALELAKRENVPDAEIEEIINQPNQTERNKFHALLKLIDKQHKQSRS